MAVGGAPLAHTAGAAERLTAEEANSLRTQICKCWKPPARSGPIVRVEVSFREDGTLAGEPLILNRQPTVLFEAFAAAARQALETCQPYDLPRAKYAAWEVVIVNFDPRELAEDGVPAPSESDAAPGGSGGPGGGGGVGREYLGS